jgi:glycosyltransferase involved in cell wall biosynthesis
LGLPRQDPADRAGARARIDGMKPQSFSGVSVIIPLFNDAATIGNAVRSALDQREVEVEVVVVDDGSTDESASVVDALDGPILYERQANAGPSAARNRGVELATHSVIAFLDADDEMLPGCLHAHLACRRAQPGLAVTLAPFRLALEDGSSEDGLIWDRVPDFEERAGFRYLSRFDNELVRFIASGSIAVDRDAFCAIGGFDTRLRCFEISDLLYRLFAHRPAVGVLDRPYVVIHRSHSDGQFVRTRSDLENRVVACHNLLDHLDRIPQSQRDRLVSRVLACLQELLLADAVNEFRRLGQRVRPDWVRGLMNRRLLVLLRLPDGWARTAGAVLRARRRLSGRSSRERSSR